MTVDFGFMCNDERSEESAVVRGRGGSHYLNQICSYCNMLDLLVM